MPDPEFILLGDAIWLDFVNTGRGRQAADPDRLPDQPAYHRWAKAEKLNSDADRVPFPDVLRVRGRLTQLAEALAAGRQPQASAVEQINELLAGVEGSYRMTRNSGRWQVQFTPGRPIDALEAIAESAARTMADPARHVRRCSAPECSLFYIDDSPDQTRAWCSSEPCGRLTRVERRRPSR